MSQHTDKPWGSEEILEQNDKYVVKKLFMKKGHQCSLQYHEDKRETVYIIQGQLKISIGHNGENIKIYNRNDYITIDPNIVHRMTGWTDCWYLECSTPELDDVIRIEDEYGRT